MYEQLTQVHDLCSQITIIELLVSEGVHLGFISQKQAEYIIVKHPVTDIFHSLPKIHKQDFLTPFHPIVAGIGSLNENLCSFVDSYLQPLVVQIPGYLRDKQQVLSALHDKRWKSVDHY